MKFLTEAFAIILISLSLSRAEPPPAGDWLNWTNTERKVVRARLLELGFDGTLSMELESGKKFTVPLDSLDPTSRKQAQQQAALLAGHSIRHIREMAFSEIKGGRFQMGSPPDEDGRVTNGLEAPRQPVAANQAVIPADPKPPADFEPEHRVDISRKFWLKKTEVTWAEWQAVMAHAAAYGYTDIGPGRNGYEGDESGRHPVTDITWWDAIKWCNLKSQIENRSPAYHETRNFDGTSVFKTGTQTPLVNWEADGYRLPTEAEWEYACREGRSTGARPWFADLKEIAWYLDNSGGNTHPVGTRVGREHRFGLVDIHGNVAEWCWDWNELLEHDEVKDPTGANSGLVRVFRGGSWADPARNCRAAYRGSYSPSPPSSPLVGFRPACGGDPLKKNTD